MTQRELEYILAIAKEGSISKAAESLFVAQPSLSRCLKKLESDLGISLFKRTPEGLKPTQAGKHYIECAETILRTYKTMENRISNLNKLKTGKLTIGTTSFLGSFILPKILKRFNHLYPSITIDIVEDVSLGIEDAIIRGEVDLGILHTPIVNKGIGVNILSRERFFLAVPADDPLNQLSYTKEGGSERYIDIRLLVDREFILTHPEQRTRQVADKIFALASVKPRIRYLTKSIQTASRLVSIGLGLTLIPQCYCKLFSNGFTLNYYFIEPEYKPFWDLVICYSLDMPMSRATEEMVRICQETIPGLYSEQTVLNPHEY
jgi:DNA-binding transcriptional LysR family regulator